MPDRAGAAGLREDPRIALVAVTPVGARPPELWQRSFYEQPKSCRAIGGSGVIAILVFALAVFLWISSNSSVPVAQAARNTVLTVFNIPQAARPDRPEQVPPGPRQRQSEAQRAASREPTPVPIQPVPPVGNKSAPATPPPAPSAAAASANSSASKQVERTTAPPAMTVPVSTVSAAQEDVAAQAAAAKADWQARVLGHLRKYRRYPRSAEGAGQQGVATISITLNRQGQVLNVQLRHGSGYPMLDTEAVATARRGSPLPAPDAAIPGDPVRVEVPVIFSLSEHNP